MTWSTGSPRLELEVSGSVPKLDADAFRAMAEHAERQCPVSNAVRATVPVTLTVSA